MVVEVSFLSCFTNNKRSALEITSETLSKYCCRLSSLVESQQNFWKHSKTLNAVCCKSLITTGRTSEVLCSSFLIGERCWLEDGVHKWGFWPCSIYVFGPLKNFNLKASALTTRPHCLHSVIWRTRKLWSKDRVIFVWVPYECWSRYAIFKVTRNSQSKLMHQATLLFTLHPSPFTLHPLPVEKVCCPVPIPVRPSS